MPPSMWSTMTKRQTKQNGQTSFTVWVASSKTAARRSLQRPAGRRTPQANSFPPS
jgi:hypothetical protein